MVSIGKLSSFIDFYNYVPLYFQTIRHKNQSSEDLYLFMGGVGGQSSNETQMDFEKLNIQQQEDVEKERKKF